MDNIFSFIRTERNDYQTEHIDAPEGAEFNQYDLIHTIELYSNSKYINGQYDALGRIKPFYNIVNRLVYLQAAAEDIDTKNVILETDNPNKYVQSLLLSEENHLWMKRAKFAMTLDHMTETRGRYGGVVVKKTESNDDLFIDVVEWRNLIVDQTDIDNGVKIERHFYTPAQLKEKTEIGWDAEAIEDAIANQAEANTADHDRPESRNTPTKYIEVYEVHGSFPKSFRNPEESDDEYEQAMFVVAGVDYTEKSENGTVLEKGSLLYSAEEEESPYKYLPYERVPNRGLGRGKVEEALQSQQWINDAVLKQKFTTDLATTVFIETDDSDFKKNALTMSPGDVIQRKRNSAGARTISLTPSSLGYFDNLIAQWQSQVNGATSSLAINSGETLPAGTPYSLAALMDQNANLPFVKKQKQMGSFIAEIYQDWVIPFLIKQVKKKHILAAHFDAEQLQFIDGEFQEFNVEQELKKRLFSGAGVASKEELDALRLEVESELAKTGTKRFIEIPEDFFEGANYYVDVLVTNEQKQKSALFTSITSILQQYMNNPEVRSDPYARELLNTILEAAGFSPVKLEMAERKANANPPQQQQQRAQGNELEQLAEAFNNNPQA